MEIGKGYYQWKFLRPKLGHLGLIAIDEIAVGSGHQYLTAVINPESGAAIFVGGGRHADTLTVFLKRLSASKKKVEAMAMELSGLYLPALRTPMPGSTVVFDHSDFMKLFKEKLTKLGRHLYHRAVALLQKNVLSGTRWHLLKDRDNLDPKRYEEPRLEEPRTPKQALGSAYHTEETIPGCWGDTLTCAAHPSFSTIGSPKRRSRGYARSRTLSRPVCSRAGTFRHIDHRLCTSPLEGTDICIKTMHRQEHRLRGCREDGHTIDKREKHSNAELKQSHYKGEAKAMRRQWSHQSGPVKWVLEMLELTKLWQLRGRLARAEPQRKRGTLVKYDLRR